MEKTFASHRDCVIVTVPESKDTDDAPSTDKKRKAPAKGRGKPAKKKGSSSESDEDEDEEVELDDEDSDEPKAKGVSSVLSFSAMPECGAASLLEIHKQIMFSVAHLF